MAKRLNYTIGVTADTSKLEASLSDAFSRLNRIGSQINLTTDLENASQAALELSSHLDKAFNRETGKFDLVTFNRSLTESGRTLESYANDLVNIGPTGEQAFLKVATAITQAELPLKRTNKLFDQLWVTMKNTMRWQLTSSVLHGFVGTLEQAYGYSKDLNRSLNEIRIVSEKSADDMGKFAEQANKAAKALSTTTVDYTDASLIYYQQGLTDQEVLDRTETTIKMANVAGTTAETASQQLTAIWNNFYDGSQSLEHYADVMVKLGAATASSSDEISEGIEKFAAVANTVGLSYEYAASALATVTAQTRESASVVGTAFRTLFSRIQGLNQGETLDDGTTLNKYSQALAKVGVQIKDTSGELKGMDEILDDLGGKWDGLAQDQKIALAETVAGVRQWTQLIALMDNWDFFKENLAMAQNADGALEQQAEVYAESWEAARDRTKAAAEDIYDSLINPDFYIGVDNIVTPLLSRTADVIDALGGLQGVLAVVALGVNKVYGDKIAQSMRDMAVNLGIITGKETERARALQNEAVSIINNLSSTYAANTAETMRLNLLRQEVSLQGEINAQYDQLDETQKQVISNEQYKLDILKQETQATIDRISQLQNSSRELQDTISVSIGTDDWQTRLRDEIRAWNQNHTAGYQININVRANSNLDRVYQEIMQQLDQLTQRRAQLQQVNEQFVKLDSSSTNYAQSLRELIGVYDSNVNTAQMTTQQLENYLKGLGTQALNTGAEIRELGNLLIGMGADRRTVTEYIAQLSQLQSASLAGENVQEQYNQKIQEFIALLQQGIPTQKDWAATLVQVGTTLSQISIGINGINSLFQTFEEIISGDTDAVDAFTKILTSLTMVLPLVANLTKEIKIENVKNAVSFLTTGAAAGTGAAGISTFSAALSTLLPVIGLVVVGIYAVVKIIQALYVSAEEAREKIQKATEAYEEQTSALESLNSELKTTKDRIDELNNQDTLTIVEEEELEKLKQQEASLERQVQLQEKLTQAAQKTQAKEIEKNYKKSTSDIVSGPGLELEREMSYRVDNGADEWYDWAKQQAGDDKVLQQEYYNQYQQMLADQWQSGYVDADTWFNSVTQGLDKTSDAYRDYLVEYQQWKDDNEQITAEWITENSEAIQEAEDNYKSYIDAVVNEAIDYNPDTVTAMQERLAAIRKNLYTSDGEYEQVVLEPILDDQAVKQVSTQLYNVLANGDIEDATSLISDSIKNELMLAGVSVDEFLTYLDNRVDKTKAAVEEKFSDFNFDELTGEDWNILATINLDNFDTVEELKDFLDNYKTNDISVDVSGIDELKDLLDTLNASQSALETALKAYKDQEGYLTMDQVQELINADESYAQYIVKVGDAYKLTNQSLQALLDSERQEEQILDATIESMKSKYAVNTDYVQNYVNMWDELVERASEADAVDNYNFTDQSDVDRFKERTQALSENAQAYRDGKISAEEYFSAINTRIGNINAGFQDLNKEIDDNIDQTDLYEATLVAATGSVADGLVDLNKQFKSGSINMDAYYRGTIAATKTLISAQSKLDKNITKNVDGTWELKEGVDRTTVSAEDYERAISDIANLNAWEKQVAQAEDMTGVVDSLVDNYDYLLQYADSFGAIDFTIDNNFDTTTQQFQDMCSSIGAELTNLEQTNTESYKRILQGVLDQGIVLADGLNTSSSDLMQAMSTDAGIASAVINSTMQEAGSTIGSLSQAASGVLSTLGDLISNFDYTLNFTTSVSGSGSGLASWAKAMFTGDYSNIKFPDIKMAISGTGGTNVQNFASALQDAADFLNSQDSGMGQGGIYDYGKEPIDFNPNGILDPDEIDSDNIKNSGGNKGKTYDKEDLKTLEEVEDRYHEINRQIERQEDLLDDLSNATDRAWGTEALNGYENEIEALEKQQELYNQKLKEAQDYLAQDSALVQKYFADAQIGANGEITNYEDLLRENLNLYNAAVEHYNLAVDGKTLSDEEYTALKNQLDAEKALFEARQKALEQYEDTLDVIRDTTDKIQENARSIADKKLEEIKFKMEIVLDVKSMKDAVRDLSKEIAEMFGDALTHGLESAKLSAEAAQAEAALLPSYQEEWNSLKALYESTTDDADRRAIMDEIQSLQGNIVDSAKAIAEWANSIEDIVPDAVDAASERFAAFTDQLEHNTSVLDTIKELYTLQGVTYKTAEGFNRLQKNSQEKLNTQLASAKLQRGWYEQAAQRLEEAQAKLDSLGGDETDLRYDAYKKARDAYLEEFNEAQEAYLSSAKEAMETAQDMYLQQIEKAVYEFGQAVSNGVGLDLLQDKYDHYIEQNERYFDKVNEAYQVSAWYNKLQQDIDNTTNSAHKERLKALQEEINQRREGNKLSQYDLDILNAKYQVLQAQMALEDAQNAKNKIQLVRDSQGNWNYQYTADQDQIANAQQNLLDAENDWYNIAKQQVTDVTGEIISTWQECQDKIKDIYSDMTLTDEERAARAEEIYEYYSEKIKYLEEEKQNAISDMTEAGNKSLIDNAIITGDTITDLTGVTAEEIKQVVENYTGDITDLLLANSEQLEEIFGDNAKFIDLFDNTYAKDLANMTQNTTNFESELRKLLDQAQADFDSYKDKVQNVASETGTTLDDLAQETDKVSDATEQLRDRGLEATDSLWDMIDAAQNASDSYLNLADSIWEAVRALQDLAAAQASFAASQGGSGSGSKKGYDPNTDYSGVIMDGIANGWLKYGSDEYNELVSQRETKIDDMGLDEDYYGSRGSEADERYKNSTGAGQYEDEEAWRKKMHDLGVPGFATGGYTGIFDDEKLAFLHQKELVLNQTDTENILAAVRTVRDLGSDFFSSIEKALDSNAIAAIALMGQKLNPIVTTPVQDSIEQTVHIDKVEFPNVTSRTEIEEAFVSLTNDAAQWARRKS